MASGAISQSIKNRFVAFVVSQDWPGDWRSMSRAGLSSESCSVEHLLCSTSLYAQSEIPGARRRDARRVSTIWQASQTRMSEHVLDATRGNSIDPALEPKKRPAKGCFAGRLTGLLGDVNTGNAPAYTAPPSARRCIRLAAW